MWLSWQVAVQAALVVLVTVQSARLLGHRHRIPKGTLTLATEVARVLLIYALWQFTREKTVTRTAGAMDNARSLWHLERWLHLPSELSLQRSFMPHDWLMTFMNGYYAIFHIPTMGAVLVWLWFRHRPYYAPVRNVLAMSTIASVLIHMHPLAPPRMMTDLGFVDSALLMGQSVYGAGGSGMSNQLAALPSLHYAWAIIAVVAVVRAGTSRWRWLIVAHLVLTALAVTATANHWWLDGVAALGVVVAAWGVQRALEAATARWSVQPVAA